MKKNSFALLALVLSLVSLLLSLFTVYRLNDMQKQLLIKNTEVNDNSYISSQTTDAKHPFDDTLIGKWTNGYWDLYVNEDSSCYISNYDLADSVKGGSTAYKKKITYIGYIENNTIIVTQSVNSSVEDCNKNGISNAKDEYESASIIREANDSLRIKTITNVQAGLSFRRLD